MSLRVSNLLLLSLLALQSCFTGVEGTQTIKADRSRSAEVTTPEQTLLSQAAPQPPAQWQAGKQFVATSGRLNVAFAPASVASQIAPGTVLTFLEATPSETIAGASVTDLRFRLPSGSVVTHRLDLSPKRLQALSSLDLPFLIDLDQVQALRRLLLHKEVWTTTLQRHTPDGSLSSGRRYEHLTIIDVAPGNEQLPLRLLLQNDQGQLSALLVSLNPNRLSPHRLDLLITLTNPRLRHKNITDQHWELICRGEVTEGMTLAECRLALGSPKEVERGTSYAALLERWIYENGIYLDFTDGLLTHFRR